MGRGSRNSSRRRVSGAPNPNVIESYPSHRLYEQARKAVIKRHEEILSRPPVRPPKTNKRYHYIHGKVYDLRDFYKSHPGGADILRMTAGLVDSTPLFESYHAFADRDGILKRLENYRVPEDEVIGDIPEPIYAFKEGDFYDTVTKRVRAHFGANHEAMDESVSGATKANFRVGAIIALQCFLNLTFYFLAFFVRALPTPVAMICAFLAGMFQIQWGFTAMHDASHWGVGKRNHWLNQAIMRTWCSWSLWNGKVWAAHHAVYHHAFTGTEGLDPDLLHALPMVRKHPDTPSTLDNGLFRTIGDRFGTPGYAVCAALLYSMIPGMWLGQVKAYVEYMFNLSDEFKNMWGLPKFSDVKGFRPKWWEGTIYAVQLLVQLQRLNPLVTMSYVIALNIFYSMCIVADHDLVESALTNHIDVELPGVRDAGEEDPESSKEDWGKVQVQNTTNFVNDRFNLFANMFGSINYQIEHHLFPGVNHIHLPKIAPIVQETCEEFGVRYTTYPKLWEAWHSFVHVVRAVMTEREKHIENAAMAKML